jgi:hypothetical protein
LKGELIEATQRAPSLLSEETTITGLMGSGMTVMFPSKKLAHYPTKAIHRPSRTSGRHGLSGSQGTPPEMEKGMLTFEIENVTINFFSCA